MRKAKKRDDLFGRVSDGFYPLRPFEWRTAWGNLLEIPVTTVPVFRVPFHLSYILWLSGISKMLAVQYMRFAFMMCRMMRVEPSFLLHPLDFLGAQDAPELKFFPGMQLSREHKMAMAEKFLAEYQKSFDVVPLSEHVRRIRTREIVKVLESEPVGKHRGKPLYADQP